MQGRSWRPLAEGSASPWRTAFLAQYFRENAYPTTPTMAVTPGWKLSEVLSAKDLKPNTVKFFRYMVIVRLIKSNP